MRISFVLSPVRASMAVCSIDSGRLHAPARTKHAVFCGTIIFWIGNVLRDFLPPILVRGLRSIRRQFTASGTHFDTNGRRIHHRGTRADAGVIQQIFRNRDYDLGRLRRNNEVLRFYESCEQPLIVDAGANIGASAVWFATKFPRAMVVAIEPESANFSFLEKNVANLSVRPVLGALAGKPGRLQLIDPGEGEWGFRTGHVGDGQSGDVRGYTIEDLIEPGYIPFILKIDIEGGEADVFETCNTDILNQFPVVVIELHDWLLPRSRTSQSFLRWHASQDRDFVYIGENVFSLCNRLLPDLTNPLWSRNASELAVATKPVVN